jgi:carbon-monoxide dehydrogenase small subunit
MTTKKAAGGRRRRGKDVAAPGKVLLRLAVNGETIETAVAPHRTLLESLREDLGLTGTKHGCELGECGTCTVLLDGRPVLSCLVLTIECEGRPIVTVEGLAQAGALHPLQTAFAELGAAQCGYCTPGILCAAKDLLDRDPNPSRDRIREALSGNLCRCTGYLKIFEAVELAARRLQDPAAAPAEETLHGRRA